MILLGIDRLFFVGAKEMLNFSACVRQLEDVFVKLRHPQGSYHGV